MSNYSTDPKWKKIFASLSEYKEHQEKLKIGRSKLGPSYMLYDQGEEKYTYTDGNGKEWVVTRNKWDDNPYRIRGDGGTGPGSHLSLVQGAPSQEELDSHYQGAMGMTQ